MGLFVVAASPPRFARSAAACCAIILARSSSAFFIAARCSCFALSSAFSLAIFSRHLRLLSARNFLTSARRFSSSSGFLLAAASSPAGLFGFFDLGSNGIVAPHAGLEPRSADDDVFFEDARFSSSERLSRSRRSRSSQNDGRMFSLHGRSPSHGFTFSSSSSSTTVAGTAVGVAASSARLDDGGRKTVLAGECSGGARSLARLMRDSFCLATVWRSWWTAFCRRMRSSSSLAAASRRASSSCSASLGGSNFLSKPAERGEPPKPTRPPSSPDESSPPRSSSPACCEMSRRSCARASACEGVASSSHPPSNPPGDESTGATTTLTARSRMPLDETPLDDPLPGLGLDDGWSAGRSAPVAAARYPADPSISPTSLAAARFAASATCFTRAIDSARWGSSAAAGPFPDPPLDAIADGAEAFETPRATSILRRRVDRPTVVSARGALSAEIFQTVTLFALGLLPTKSNPKASHRPRPLRRAAACPREP